MNSDWNEMTIGAGYWETMIDRGYADEEMVETPVSVSIGNAARQMDRHVIVEVDASSTGSIEGQAYAPAGVIIIDVDKLPKARASKTGAVTF